MGSLCYFALFHGSSISDFKVFPNYLCVHIFHGNTFFVATRYFSLYFSGKIVILLSQHSKRQSQVSSSIGAQDSLVITTLLLFSILVGEAK